MKRVTPLILTVTVLVGLGQTGTCASQMGFGARIERLASMYDFVNWPGKDGPVRDGFRLAEDILPSGLLLERVGEPSASVDPDTGRLHVLRRYTVTAADGTGRLTVDVTVAGTCIEAQEKLMRLVGSTSSPQPPLIPRGAEYGLSLGDVCFAVGEKHGDLLGVMWVRNNVLVRTTAQSKDVCPFTERLARALDAAISQRATFKSYAECPSRPIITKVARVSGSEEVQTLEVNWKAVEVTAPQGEELKYFPSHRVFPKDKLKGRGWASYQVAVSESNLIGFPLSGSARWKSNGRRPDEVNGEVDAFLKRMERPAGR